MKNTNEIRKERNILPPSNPDSEYPKQIEREERVFAPLIIPKVNDKKEIKGKDAF